MNISYLIVIILPLILCSCEQNPKGNTKEIYNNPNALTKTEIYIDLEKALKKRSSKDILAVQVEYDHYFKSPKKYKGYYINTIVDSIVKLNNFDTTNAIIIFECTDGYNPIMNFSKLFGNTKGYIVYKDLDQKSEKNWADSISAKFKPYYLVWDNVKKEDNSFMWPYGLIGLKLISKDKANKYIYPQKKSLLKGFNLYKDYCMKCHSINKIGGSMGPEFNVPKNITEYWKEEDIISFAKNPEAYRYNSKMPPITNIKDSDFKEIILYIKYMKNNKIK